MSLHLKLLDIEHPLTLEESKLRQIEAHALIYLRGFRYKSQLSEDHWREKYKRNVKQSVRGFYTPAHFPYASVGDICLDVKLKTSL